ncbi:MAG: hypothetical protein R3C58_00160 [Parvularculaceae bacterium]
MTLDFDTIAEFTRLTARLSLSLFCVAFVIDAMKGKATGFFYALFIVAHLVHLGFVAAYYMTAGHGPELSPVLGLLVLGLAALAWLATAVFRARPAPLIAVWFLWFLFAATHVSRLLDPERAGAINWVLLAVALSAAAARLYLGLVARRAM